jgi:hypothetical protein
MCCGTRKTRPCFDTAYSFAWKSQPEDTRSTINIPQAKSSPSTGKETVMNIVHTAIARHFVTDVRSESWLHYGLLLAYFEASHACNLLTGCCTVLVHRLVPQLHGINMNLQRNTTLPNNNVGNVFPKRVRYAFLKYCDMTV